MFIATEATPNPATVKFIAGGQVMPHGTADFRMGDDCTASPLAARLFDLPGVAGVFLGPDFVSVTKENGVPWESLKPMVLAALMDHALSGLPAVQVQVWHKPIAANDAVTQKILDFLDTRIRPGVSLDGGDVVFQKFEDGILYLEMRGACAGCPRSGLTLKAGIETLLKQEVPEVREVRQAA